MSVKSFNLNEEERSNRLNCHEVDELVSYGQSHYRGNELQQWNTCGSRSINLILDHSAFVRGIGNIKRWFNEEYIKSNMKFKKIETIHLNIYIPTYTLHEFDYVKKGTSMMATNAREAIRFIDKFFEKEENNSDKNMDAKRDSNNDKKQNPIIYNLYIESSAESGPSWRKCLEFKMHSPKIKEFPNFKTKFDSNLIGQHPISINEPGDYSNDFSLNDLTNELNTSLSFKQANKLNDIQYENSPSYQNAVANSDNHAEMPIRLRYLIRSCIYKRFIEKNDYIKSDIENWKLVTEDPISKIWIKSFGIDCLNVNEAELLIFQNYDVNQFRLYNPHKNCSIDDDDNLISNNILQNTIDTTLYSYTTMDHEPKRGNKKKSKKSKPKKVEGIVNQTCTGVNGDSVKKERFDAINYAPRGSGELWTP